MKHISLFSGIGGFELASHWAGWTNVASCEINPFGQRVLEYYWPEAYHHNDIHTLTYDTINTELSKRFGDDWRREELIITGGFPCQPYSLAGKRLGKDDERHLWPEMLRVIRDVKPEWVVGENVFGLINWNGGLVFDEVQADLEASGYEVQAYVLPACGVNAPHKRERVWIVANLSNSRVKKMREREIGIYGFESTPDTGLLGQKERQQQSMGTKQLCQEQPTAHSPSTGRKAWKQVRRPENTEENGTRMVDEPKRFSNDEITPDTESKQSKRMQPEQREFGAQEQRKFRGNGSWVGDRATPDTSNERLQRSKLNGSFEKERQGTGKQSPGSATELYQVGNWDNFPTQSPVCGGNDGIPRELDGITFPKWRAESIKAFGNAIVPQVAYQIFKAINKYNSIQGI